jgi:spermidine/putrescine transport system substrate-binding protein
MKSKPLPADPMIRELIRRAQTATMGRRTLLAGAAAGATGLALAACSTDTGELTAAPDTSATDKTVRWDNWALYVDVDDAGGYPTIEAFEAQAGIAVEYTEAVDDNNTYYAKVKDQLSLGQDIGTDVVCLTDWMVARLIRFGYAQKFDQANIPNAANLLPSLQNVDFDPGRASLGRAGLLASPGTRNNCPTDSDLFRICGNQNSKAASVCSLRCATRWA